MTSVLALNDTSPPGAREPAVGGTNTPAGAELNRSEAGTRLHMRGCVLAISALPPVTTEQAGR
ncbi:MAG: hypothetical protein ABI593_11605 [Betaproteobacteria bacterium]